MVSLANNVLGAPIPLQDPIAQPRDHRQYPNRYQRDPNEGLATPTWASYLSQSAAVQAQQPVLISKAVLAGQSTSLSPSVIASGALNAGLYRITWYARITTVASVSSSLTVTIAWTDDAVSLSYAGAAITGNTITTTQTASILLETDANSPITYETTYATVGTTMVYKLDVALEKIP